AKLWRSQNDGSELSMGRTFRWGTQISAREARPRPRPQEWRSVYGDCPGVRSGRGRGGAAFGAKKNGPTLAPARSEINRLSANQSPRARRQLAFFGAAAAAF